MLSFSEKDFYLAEFRSRTIGIVLPSMAVDERNALTSLLRDFDGHDIRVLVVSGDREGVAALDQPVVDLDRDELWPGAVWRALKTSACAVLAVDRGRSLEAAACEVALELSLVKLVWIDKDGGLKNDEGQRRSFVDLAELDGLLGSVQQPLLHEIRRMISAGVPAVNLCAAAGLADELLSYAGSGTLFTRDRYTDVRRLALDEYATAHDLVARGIDEGYLVKRSTRELDRILANAFGVFVSGRHLAGIGALLPNPEARAGEIASLYTLTRFLGDGVGGQLVRFALERARAAGFEYAFACTTSVRVESFFVRQGFRRVEAPEVPESKWRDYSEARRAEVMCLRLDLH